MDASDGFDFQEMERIEAEQRQDMQKWGLRLLAISGIIFFLVIPVSIAVGRSVFRLSVEHMDYVLFGLSVLTSIFFVFGGLSSLMGKDPR